MSAVVDNVEHHCPKDPDGSVSWDYYCPSCGGLGKCHTVDDVDAYALCRGCGASWVVHFGLPSGNRLNYPHFADQLVVPDGPSVFRFCYLCGAIL